MTDLVGVSLRVIESTGYHETRDAISHDWVSLLSQYWVIPLLVSNALPNLLEILEKLQISALLLSSGNNVGPLDEDERGMQISDVSNERDKTEREIVDFAIEHRVPLLGVCRGMQMLNTYFGGRIVRDLTEICGSPNAHVSTNHHIEFIDPDYRHRLGTSNASTNSFHCQAVSLSTLSSQLCPFALADDGIVEGLYHPNLPIWGIQWHPERANPAREVDRILIETWLGRRKSICT